MTVTSLSRRRVLVLVDGQNLLGYLDDAQYRRIEAQAFVAWCATFGRPTIKWFQGAWPGTASFFSHLRAAGIEVHTKTPKTLPGGRCKADMDMEIGLAAIAGAPTFDTILLVTGDGDFVPVVQTLGRAGVAVHLLCPTGSTARELLAVVDPEHTYDLDDELPMFGSNPGEAA